MSDKIPEMTMRDYFAAHALQGILAGDAYQVIADEAREKEEKTGEEVDDGLMLAALAYVYADAMLEARDLELEDKENEKTT